MRKYKRKYLEIAIKKNKTSYSDSLLIIRELRFSSLFTFCFALLFFVYSLLNKEQISKLAIITADTIFNHEVIFSPAYYYFVCLLILVIITFVMFLIANLLRCFLKSDITKKLYRIFKMYDLTTFVMAILVSINFIIMFIITPVTIDGNSMKNTLNSDDKVLIWHYGYKPENDDIIIFDAESIGYKGEFFVKRIVSSPNDILTIEKNARSLEYYSLYCNDNLIEDELTIEEWNNITGFNEEKKEFILPEDKYLIMGDNRDASFDGRSFGLIDEKDILGKVIIRYYPFNKIGLL